jgi:exodeoxyribonuclease VII large subunit
MESRLFDPDPTLTVGQLNQRIGTVLRNAFPSEVWVRGEIHGLKRHQNGHVFFELTDSDERAARLSVVLWESNKRGVNLALKRSGAGRMSDGLEVRIRGEIVFHEPKGSLQLRMVGIDPEYTLGRLAAERDRLVRALHHDGLLDRNARVPMPLVPLRVGLVTSDDSAACTDFLTELEASAMGWRVTLVDARVQGVAAGPTVVAALATAEAAGVDVVALVRGGGSRTDLAAFDGEPIARAVALLSVPVLTGIGHEVDESVADLVAHTSFKTPTACAAGLVAHVRGYRERCERVWSSLDRSARERLASRTRWLDTAEARLGDRAPRALARAGRLVDGLEARVRSLDPARALARGWSITRRGDGTVVRSADEVAPGDALVTALGTGEVRSTVDG